MRAATSWQAAASALLAPVIAPYRYDGRNLPERFQQPSLQHLAGTDTLGRDVFSRILYGGRVSLGVSASVVLLSTSIAGLIGVLGGYAGRWVDVVLLLAIITVLGPSVRNVILVLSLPYGFTGSRALRSAVLSLKQEVHIETAPSIGCSGMRVALRRLLPNILATVIVLGSLRLGSVMIVEAWLSITVFGFNVLGDALRDLSDPRLRS